MAHHVSNPETEELSLHSIRTLYRYASMFQNFSKWYGEPLDIKIKRPKPTPPYNEDAGYLSFFPSKNLDACSDGGMVTHPSLK
jgi:hypothetical protein